MSHSHLEIGSHLGLHIRSRLASWEIGSHLGSHRRTRLALRTTHRRSRLGLRTTVICDQVSSRASCFQSLLLHKRDTGTWSRWAMHAD